MYKTSEAKKFLKRGIVMKQNGNCKRKKILAIGLIMIVCVGIVGVIELTKHVVAAGKAEVPNISFDLDADFCILEIVPYKGVSEVGYLVGGEEPIDLTNPKFEKDYTYANTFERLIGKNVVRYDKYYHHKFVLEEGERAEDYNIGTETVKEVYPNSTITEDGYFLRVEDNTGLYELEEWHADFKPSYFKVNAWSTKRNYVWVASKETGKNKKPRKPGDKVYFKNATRQLAYYYRGKYINQESFKLEVLALEKDEIDNFKVDVKSVTPEELNANLGLIRDSNYIYINPYLHNIDFVRLYEMYGKQKKTEAVTYYPQCASYIGCANKEMETFPNFYRRYTEYDGRKYRKPVSNDISWEAARRILEAVAKRKVAISIDTAVYTYYSDYWKSEMEIPYEMHPFAGRKGTANNIAKIFIALSQWKATVFYDKFMDIPEGYNESYIRKKGKKITDCNALLTGTGYFNSDVLVDMDTEPLQDYMVYWNERTFLPPESSKPKDKTYKEYLKEIGVMDPEVATNTYRVIYSFASNNTNVPLCGSYLKQEFSKGYEEVREYVRERDNLSTTPKIVSGADVLQYIIQLGYQRAKFYRTSLKILEIQPSKESELTKKQVATWTNRKIPEENIEIVTMSTAQFIGTNENLSETYDLIYLGMNDHILQATYNDSSLNQKAYVHVGDKIQCDPKLGGLLDRDYVGGSCSNILVAKEDYGGRTSNLGYYRYSGNDITKLKYEELKKYANDGFPVIIADGFYKGTKEISVNEDKLDRASYLYEFVKQHMPDSQRYKNVQKEGKVRPKVFSELLMYQKLSLTLSKQPKEYGYNLAYEEDIPESAYLRKDKKGEYVLEYEFKINAIKELLQAGNRYDVKLWIDENGDGRYTDRESYSSFEITQYGMKLAPTSLGYQLEEGKEYVLRCHIPNNLYGAIPWKLQIVQTTDAKITTSVTGCCAIKCERKPTLRVLQINSSSTQLKDIEAVTINLQKQQKDTTSYLYKYTKNLNDFHIEFVTITVDDFIKLYETNKEVFDSYFKTGEGNQIYQTFGYKPMFLPSKNQYEAFDYNNLQTSRLLGFDMVILGGAKALQDISNESATMDLLLFSQIGKSLIVTNGTMSTVNVPLSQYHTRLGPLHDFYGYQMNTWLRDMVGMDRFGITLKNLKKRFPSLTMQQYPKIDEMLHKKDAAYSLNSRGTTYQEVQGFSNSILSENSIEGQLLTDVYDKTNGIMANQIESINKGSILNYPYRIPDKLNITAAIAQPYQLDMEADVDSDGNSDTIVWCTLASSEYGIYQNAPKDASNNYYLYTKRNVSYSGLGLSAIPTREEIKLFINTLVTTYRYTRTETTIEVIGAKSKSGYIPCDDYYMYCDYDVDLARADCNNAVIRTRFIARNQHVREFPAVVELNHDSYVRAKILDPDTNQPVKGMIKEGKEYVYEFPLQLLKNANSHGVSIRVGAKKVAVLYVRRNLFNLD